MATGGCADGVFSEKVTCEERPEQREAQRRDALGREDSRWKVPSLQP